MTEFQFLAPYHILIVDDADEKSDFGPITKNTLELIGCFADWVKTRKDAIDKIQNNYYDVLILDIDLGAGHNQDGFVLQKTIRNSGKIHPIIMVTGQNDQLERPIRDYKEVFASGPTYFYEKGNGNILTVFEQAVKNIDPIRRALYLLKDTGYKDKPLIFGGEEYSIEDLLIDNGKNEQLIRQLRDAFYELFIELWRNGDKK